MADVANRLPRVFRYISLAFYSYACIFKLWAVSSSFSEIYEVYIFQILRKLRASRRNRENEDMSVNASRQIRKGSTRLLTTTYHLEGFSSFPRAIYKIRKGEI
jgi:hypothetical protein